MYIPDALDQWERHDAEQEEALELLPICEICEEHIQDEECYEIFDKYICKHCLKESKVYVKDLIG